MSVKPLATELSKNRARQIPGNKNQLFSEDSVLETGFLNSF